MAGFQEQLLAFNPYVAQIPQSYSNIGLYKQQEYDLGVQKVQSYIDSIAGLNVAKDAHKQYIQSRLTDLTNSINSQLANADFSKGNIVSQVGYYANKVADDPIVQGAVLSTARLQQGFQEIQDAKKKGEGYSVSNEWDFMNKYQSWSVDPDLKATFNDSYTPYRDVRKKTLDIIKALDPASTITQVPFIRNADGTLRLDKNGAPEIDDALIEQTTKGVSPERLSLALQGQLDASDYNQLGIEGRFAFRGETLETFGKKIMDSYQYQLDNINDTINNYQARKLLDSKNAATYEDNIDAQKERAKNLRSEYKATMENMYGDFEGSKASLYTNNFLAQTSNALSYSENSTKYLANPYAQMARDRERISLQYEDLKLKDKEFQLHQQEFGLKRDELAFKMTQVKKGKATLDENGNLVPFDFSVPLGQPINIENAKKQTEFSTLVNATDALEQGMISGKNAIIAALRPDLVNEQADGSFLIKPDKKREAETIFEEARQTYNKGTASPDIKQAMSYLDDNQLLLDARKSVINDVNSKYTQTLSKTLKSPPPTEALSIPLSALGSTKNGRVTITYEDWNQLGKVASTFSNTSGGTGGASAILPDQTVALTSLYDKYGRETVDALVDVYRGRRSLGTNENKWIDRARAAKGEIYIKSADVPDRNELLRQRSLIKAPQARNFDTGKEEDRKRIRNLVQEKLNSYQAGETIGGDYSVSKISKLLDDVESTYSIIPGLYGQPSQIVVSKGDRVQSIQITEDEKSALTGDQFEDPSYSTFGKFMELTRGRTTDATGKGKLSALPLQNGILNKYDVRYHIDNKLGTGNIIRLYIYNKDTKKSYDDVTFPAPTTLSNGKTLEMINGINDASIDVILKRQNKK